MSAARANANAKYPIRPFPGMTPLMAIERFLHYADLERAMLPVGYVFDYPVIILGDGVVDLYFAFRPLEGRSNDHPRPEMIRRLPDKDVSGTILYFLSENILTFQDFPARLMQSIESTYQESFEENGERRMVTKKMITFQRMVKEQMFPKKK